MFDDNFSFDSEEVEAQFGEFQDPDARADPNTKPLPKFPSAVVNEDPDEETIEPYDEIGVMDDPEAEGDEVEAASEDEEAEGMADGATAALGEAAE